MIMCVCKAVSDSDLRHAIQSHDNSLSDIINDTGITTDCGICTRDVKKLYKELVGEDGKEE
jgi:bacterioferritin-associated ferredoxin